MGPILGIALLSLVGQAELARNESNDARRARLVEECSHGKRWKLTELEHYFLVSDVDDRNVLGELERRVEAVRRALGLVINPPPRSEQSPGPAGPKEPPSKTLLRVHAAAETYIAGGGLRGTNGLYFPERTEIVVHSGLQSAGRAELYRMAQSVVVQEVLDRQLGTGEHAPWFVSGLQDYFAGFGFRNGRLERKPHAARLEQVRVDLRAQRTVALVDFVLLTRAEYDGENTWSSNANSIWAEGWAFMWFLMTADTASVDGPSVVARYLAKWKEKRDPAAATRAAFEGVDWDALELEWRAFVSALDG